MADPVRALVIRDGAVTLDERPDPAPRPSDAVVRVSLAGICGTDLELLAGYKEFEGVPGHEMVGVVERADAAPSLVGRRVVAAINVGCGDCSACAHAGPGHCPERRVLGIRGLEGALAERVVLPAANLHPVPDGVPDRAAVFAEPLAAACRIVEQVRVGPRRVRRVVGGRKQTVAVRGGLRVVVVGAGRLGSLCAMVLRRAGGHVEAVTSNGTVGALLERDGVAVRRRVEDVAPGADVVVDATGSPDGLVAARSLVRPRGTLVLKSTCAPGAGAGLDPTALVVDEITVIGSRCGSIPRALRLLSRGKLDPSPLIEHVVPLHEGPRAFEAAARRGALKILVAPGG